LIVPALPTLLVVTEILPPSATVMLPPDNIIWPAFALVDVVLNSPVPAPIIVALDAFSAIAPPRPLPVVLLFTVAPLVILRLPRLSATFPAAPAVDVATEMTPPSVSDNV
jgi:hypothetical protein